MRTSSRFLGICALGGEELDHSAVKDSQYSYRPLWRRSLQASVFDRRPKKFGHCRRVYLRTTDPSVGELHHFRTAAAERYADLAQGIPMEFYPGRPMVLGAAEPAEFFFRRLLELLDLNSLEAGGHLQHSRTKLFKTKTNETGLSGGERSEPGESPGRVEPDNERLAYPARRLFWYRIACRYGANRTFKRFWGLDKRTDMLRMGIISHYADLQSRSYRDIGETRRGGLRALPGLRPGV